MLLAYLPRSIKETIQLELCVVADKLDHLSLPLPISSLIPTEAAIIRLGPYEAMKVSLDQQDSGSIIEPISPSKMYLTPSQPDRPGVSVLAVKVVHGDGKYRTYFMQEKDRAKADPWKEYNPNQLQA